MSESGDMSIHWLLFQWALKIKVFSPWYSWKIGIKQQSLTRSLDIKQLYFSYLSAVHFKNCHNKLHKQFFLWKIYFSICLFSESTSTWVSVTFSSGLLSDCLSTESTLRCVLGTFTTGLHSSTLDMPIWNAGATHSPHGHLSPENNYK